MLQKATELETAIIDQYAQFTKDAWGEGDMSDFHFFQHLSKWHGCGDDKYVGHLSTLQKWSWQIAKTGEPDFIAAKKDPS